MNKKKEFMGIAMKGMMDAMKAMEKAMEEDSAAEAPEAENGKEEKELDKALVAAVNEHDEAAPVKDISEKGMGYMDKAPGDMDKAPGDMDKAPGDMDKAPQDSDNPEVMGIPAALMHGIIGHGGYMKAYGGMEYKGMRNDFMAVNGHLRDLAKKADMGMGQDEE